MTKNTSRRDSELTSESESDGCYIDAPLAWLNLHPPPDPGTFHTFHAVLSSGGKRDDFRFTQLAGAGRPGSWHTYLDCGSVPSADVSIRSRRPFDILRCSIRPNANRKGRGLVDVVWVIQGSAGERHAHPGSMSFA
jgi:hypothetical protein